MQVYTRASTLQRAMSATALSFIESLLASMFVILSLQWGGDVIQCSVLSVLEFCKVNLSGRMHWTNDITKMGKREKVRDRFFWHFNDKRHFQRKGPSSRIKGLFNQQYKWGSPQYWIYFSKPYQAVTSHSAVWEKVFFTDNINNSDESSSLVRDYSSPCYCSHHIIYVYRDISTHIWTHQFSN